MRKIIRIILIMLLVTLILIQFIRPPKNISTGIGVNDITTKYDIPGDIEHILKTSCYDCHSNNTSYPWYWQIQPVTWFMNGHIKDAKRGLNFSTFASYNIRKQYKSFDNINKEVKNGDMPLTSYTLIHRDAILNDTQKLAIANWAAISRKEIENHYPPDSLKSNKPNGE
ncbi:MAG: heme-binding domain-containing protein [Ginsengibacter sp.]